MQIETAELAGELAKKMREMEAHVATVQGAIERGAAFNGYAGLSDQSGTAMHSLPGLSAEETAPLLQGLLQIFSARLAALRAELKSIGA